MVSIIILQINKHLQFLLAFFVLWLHCGADSSTSYYLSFVMWEWSNNWSLKWNQTCSPGLLLFLHSLLCLLVHSTQRPLIGSPYVCVESFQNYTWPEQVTVLLFCRGILFVWVPVKYKEPLDSVILLLLPTMNLRRQLRSICLLVQPSVTFNIWCNAAWKVVKIWITDASQAVVWCYAQYMKDLWSELDE